MSRNSDNTLIYYPVNTWDVSKVTRKGSGDVGTLCGSNQMINKWAKYKPVIYPNLINTYDQLNSDKTWKSTATWWKASDGKCGFTIGLRTSGSALVTNWGTDWTYNPPTGGMAAPYRLIDFNYYDHAAVSPVYVTYPSSYVKNSGSSIVVNFNAFYGNSNRLLLTDVTNGIWSSQQNPSMYCGVLLVIGMPNTSYDSCTKISVVNPTALGTGSTDSAKYNRTVTVPNSSSTYDLDNFNEGAEIKIYPFLCQNAYETQVKPNSAGTDVSWEYGVVACPSEMTTINVVTAWIGGTLTINACSYLVGGVKIKFDYDILGHNGFNKTVTAFLYVLDNDYDTSGQYPYEEMKNGKHIISYGTATNNPCMGQTFTLNVPDGVTRHFDQTTLMDENDIDDNDFVVVGIDAASYKEDYRRRHGSTADVKVTLLVEFHDNSTGIYGNAFVENVTITGA